MQQIFKLKQYFKNLWEKTKKYCSSYRHVCVFSFAIVLLILAFFYVDIERITFVNFFSGVIAVIGLVLFFMRVDIQIKQRVDERFTTAVNLLGSSETSARTEAIYSLFHLALDEKKYRKEIAQILCSHIRSKTEEKDYQKKHKNRPSNEIQTTINLLFKKDGLYHKFNKELEPADLRHAFLAGANFSYAHCQGADFMGAKCQGAWFLEAQCQGARFLSAQCQWAWFLEAQCQGAYFCDAQCQGAYFWNTQCQGVNFENAECQGANFFNTQCQGAGFLDTQCQGAYSTRENLILEKRIGENTELDNVIFAGALNHKIIQSIESARAYFSNHWYQRMQKIIKENEGEKTSHKLPKGIITGKLEDSEEMQAIIAKDWEKLERIQAEKRKK